MTRITGRLGSFHVPSSRFPSSVHAPENGSRFLKSESTAGWNAIRLVAFIAGWFETARLWKSVTTSNFDPCRVARKGNPSGWFNPFRWYTVVYAVASIFGSFRIKIIIPSIVTAWNRGLVIIRVGYHITEIQNRYRVMLIAQRCARVSSSMVASNALAHIYERSGNYYSLN